MTTEIDQPYDDRAAAPLAVRQETAPTVRAQSLTARSPGSQLRWACAHRNGSQVICTLMTKGTTR